MKRALLTASALVAALVAAPEPATAQDDDPIRFSASGGLRVRGFALHRNTAAQFDTAGAPTGDGIRASNTYLDTRLRLSLGATVLDEVSAKLAIEVGDFKFGDDDGTGTTAGRLGGDARVFENKNLYLEWHPSRYSFRVKAGLYGRESDPYGLILSNDVAGVAARVELLGTGTEVYADFIKAVENSRRDLDGDGIVDNDYNDRDVVIAGVTSRFFEVVALEAFYVADLDDSQDTPAGTTERVVHWAGLSARGRVGPVTLSGTGILAYGRQSTTGTRATIVRGYAFDARVQLSIPFLTIEAIYAQASGDRTSTASADERFPTVTPYYGQSAIVYNNFGGFDATGSDLAGTGWVGLKLRAAPTDALGIEALALWAWYTADHDLTGHSNEFHADARDLGFEVDLNVTYTVVTGFKAFARGAVLFPGRGYMVHFDTDRRGALLQMIVGAQFSF